MLLLVFAGVTLGGLGTAFGAIVGSLIVGVLIQVSTLVVPPELKNVGALAILDHHLLIRTPGHPGSGRTGSGRRRGVHMDWGNILSQSITRDWVCWRSSTHSPRSG